MYFCTDRIRHASRRTANQGGSFIFDDMNIYTKQPLSITDQIARLKAQGLVVNDEELAAKVLGEISYFRFAAYLRPMEANKQTHQFKPGLGLVRPNPGFGSS